MVLLPLLVSPEMTALPTCGADEALSFSLLTPKHLEAGSSFLKCMWM
ncbi:MAG: hypothetical protein WCP39_05795 [Chlamydiota bacterium]